MKRVQKYVRFYCDICEKDITHEPKKYIQGLECRIANIGELGVHSLHTKKLLLGLSVGDIWHDICEDCAKEITKTITRLKNKKDIAE